MKDLKDDKLRIAFVYPRPLLDDIMANFQPLGILNIVAYLEKHFQDEITIRIFDQNVTPDIVENIIKFKPQLVAVSALTTNILNAYRLCDELREKTDAKILIGGKHVSALPEEAAKHAHYAVVGEGELIMKDLVEGMLNNKLPSEAILHGPYIKDLDEIPPLPYHYLDMDFYLDPRHNITAAMRLTRQTIFRKYKYHTIGMLTSRGCPFKCIFCYNSKKSSPVRYHSAERCIEDIERAIKEYNVDTIVFVDDEFLTNKKRLDEFCRLINQKRLKFNWSCQARADVINKEILQLIKSCGCKLINFGFESGSDNVLKLLGKGGKSSVEANLRAIQLCNNVGIKVSGSFMLGTPGETLDDINKTFKFIKENKIIVGLAITTPYPGTVLWDRCVEQGLIDMKNIDYSKLNFTLDNYLNNDVVPYDKFSKIHRGVMRYVALFRMDLSPYEKIKRISKRIPKLIRETADIETLKTFKKLLSN
jgi:radical SAM superfamily enzyme YgiQ (UPF0313 family)